MIRYIVPASIAVLLSSPLYADAIAQGILLPKKDTQAISFSPKNSKEMFILDVMPQGSNIKKGDSIATSDLRALDDSISDYERSIKSRQLSVMRLKFDLEQQKATSNQQVKIAKQALLRSEEDLKDFLEKRKERMLAEEEERVAKSLRNLKYKQEELNQLIKMYKDDQVSEETEEIILTRLKNELSETQFAVEGAKLISELAKLRTINRMDEDLKSAIDSNKLKVINAEGHANFDIEEKQLALTNAEVALKRTQTRLDELKADRQMAEFKSPVNGILIYGGYVGDRWEANTIAAKLKPGGKLDPFDKVGTIVPPNTELIVQAVLPDSAPTPKEGEQVVMKVTNMQVPGTVTKANSIPDSDGKRRIIVTPQIPADKIFAPGLPVQVTIKTEQS